jgi:hypothetical protein
MATAPLHTPLTHDFPSTASLGRSDLIDLLGSWDPSRPSVPWYQQQRQQQLPTAPPLSVPLEEQAFEAFIESLPEVKLLRQETESLIRESEDKAGKLQPVIYELR